MGLRCELALQWLALLSSKALVSSLDMLVRSIHLELARLVRKERREAPVVMGAYERGPLAPFRRQILGTWANLEDRDRVTIVFVIANMDGIYSVGSGCCISMICMRFG
jgi:hypothetical protein